MAQKLVTYFRDFLKEIRLTDNQVRELKTAHETLRKRLLEDEELSSIIETTFLQGSYRRATAIRPKNGKRSDVDIVVVTKLDKDEVTPDEALDVFEDFLEKYYEGKYRKQGRSWGIEMSHVELDVVPTAAAALATTGILNNLLVSSDMDIMEIAEYGNIGKYYSERELYEAFSELFAAEESSWKDDPLFIPDSKAQIWDKTHPLEQIRWTQEKNSNCNSHYVNVVKCIKWWRREKFPDSKPKSYPLEHLIGECCPDGIDSVAEGITRTLENIVTLYPNKPFLSDRGVPEHDVFGRVTEEEYNEFYATVCDAAILARNAYDADKPEEAAKLWRELLGNKFPVPESNKGVAFTKRESDSRNLSGGRFA